MLMRIHKTYSLNHEVIKEFEKQVPKKDRSRVLDVLMIKYMIDGVGTITDIKNGDKSPKVLPSPIKEKESTLE